MTLLLPPCLWGHFESQGSSEKSPCDHCIKFQSFEFNSKSGFHLMEPWGQSYQPPLEVLGTGVTVNMWFSFLLRSSWSNHSPQGFFFPPNPLSYSVCRVRIWDVPQSHPVGEKDSPASGIWAGPFQPWRLVPGQAPHPQCEKRYVRD